MKMLDYDLDCLLDYEIFIQIRPRRSLMVMWLLDIDWCIIPLCIKEKQKLYRLWMNESEVLMSHVKIHEPNGMGFKVWYELLDFELLKLLDFEPFELLDFGTIDSVFHIETRIRLWIWYWTYI